MPEENRSLGDLIKGVALRKQQAGQARFGHQPPTDESPKDIYAAACATIGLAFATDGYRFAASGPHFTRRDGDFVFKVSFQSSHNNVAGEYVAMLIHARVLSPTLKKWRAEHASVRGPLDFVAGGQIGNLLKPSSWIEWNLASLTTRQAEVDSAIRKIRDAAIPYFENFADPLALCGKLRDAEIPSMQLADMFDFAACFCSLSAAREIAAAFLARRPELANKYYEKMDEFRSQGSPERCSSGYAEVLAAISARFQLGDLGKPATP